jgi:hypothetical protein
MAMLSSSSATALVMTTACAACGSAPRAIGAQGGPASLPASENASAVSGVPSECADRNTRRSFSAKPGSASSSAPVPGVTANRRPRATLWA